MIILQIPILLLNIPFYFFYNIFICINGFKIVFETIGDLLGNLSLWLYLPKYIKGVKVKNINTFRHIWPIILLFIPQIANQIYKIL